MKLRTSIVSVLTIAFTWGMFASCSADGSAAGGFSLDANVSFKVDLPKPADLPPKYAAWVVEVQGFLENVQNAQVTIDGARMDLAASFGMDKNSTADAVAAKIRESIKKTVKVEVTCTPGGANLVANCTADASAQAKGNGKADGSGASAGGGASADVQANCEAKMEFTAPSCGIKTTENVQEDPILKANWENIQKAIQAYKKVPKMTGKLNGRADKLNSRGLDLSVQSVTDIAGDVTLAMRFKEIQDQINKGAESCKKSNDRLNSINHDTNAIGDALAEKFPGVK